MQTVNTVEQLNHVLDNARQQGKSIGFVPTMGNLHYGHISLVEQARQNNDLVVVSIFVNPLQFAAGEDLDTYPRTLAEDQRQLQAIGCDLVFAPTVAELYPNSTNVETVVDIPELSQLQGCGYRSR